MNRLGTFESTYSSTEDTTSAVMTTIATLSETVFHNATFRDAMGLPPVEVVAKAIDYDSDLFGTMGINFDDYVDDYNMTYNTSWDINGTMWGNGTLVEVMPRWKFIVDQIAKWILTFNVIFLMLGMGCAIYWKDVVNHMWPPIGLCIGMLGQFIVLPATGFGLAVIFNLRPSEALGCLIVSCSPGGSFSNFFTYWLDGDLALSVVMTTFSSILAFGGMPLNLWLYSSRWIGETGDNITIEIPYATIMRALSFICGPVLVGMVIRHFTQRVARIITRITSLMGYAGFLTVLTCWLLLYWKVFVEATPLIYASATILPVTGFILAYILAIISRRSHKVCRTIGIETGSQNMPVALNIIILSFDDPKLKSQMIVFPTLYGILMLTEVITAILIYQIIKRKVLSKKNDKKKEAALGTAQELEKINP